MIIIDEEKAYNTLSLLAQDNTLYTSAISYGNLYTYLRFSRQWENGPLRNCIVLVSDSDSDDDDEVIKMQIYQWIVNELINLYYNIVINTLIINNNNNINKN